MILLVLVVFAAGVLFGRATARVRPAHTAVAWAEGQLQIRTCCSPLFWAAAFAVLAALVAVWVFHPVRSMANVLTWREQPPAPAPERDPDWAAKRGATTNGEDSL